MSLGAGAALGSYTLVAPIGNGGMGSVWSARRNDGRFDTTVAVKLLHAACIGRAAEERFRREGGFLARLTHPHIARLVDAGVSSTGQPYLVLEHVEGQALDRYCDEHRLDVHARIRLFLDVLGAVAHAHRNLIVHRDLTPSNVLVTRGGEVKLLDFGVAKLLDDERLAGHATLLTLEGGLALTPEYAAPEQLTGGPVTTATDVYALGVMLFRLLTGLHPAGGLARNPADLVKAIVELDQPRMSTALATDSKAVAPTVLADHAAHRATTPDRLCRVLQDDLDTIVARAMRRRASERYASVIELADDLRRYLAHEPILARADTAGYRALKFARRHAASLAGGAAVVTLVAALAAFYTTQLTAQRDRARLEAAKAEHVSNLMTGLLVGQDSDQVVARDELTVRQMLDSGAARIDEELAGDPALQAEMLTMLGRTYERLGAYDRAQPLLERAVALAEAADSSHERVGQALNNLGVLLRAKADFAASVATLERALVVRRARLGDAHKDVAITLVELGRSYKRLAMPERAEPLYREALWIRRQLFGEHHRETATNKGDLGVLLLERGALTEAEPLLRECLDTSVALLGAAHPNVAAARDNLGLLAAEQHDYATAEAIFRQALDAKRKSVGLRHPTLAVTLSHLGSALREQGRYDEAVIVLEEAIELARAAMGPLHPTVAEYLAELGQVFAARGDASLAEPLLRQALVARARAFGERDWRVAATKSALAGTLIDLERYQEAKTLLVDAHRILRDGPGEQGREARATARRLADLDAAFDRAASLRK